MTPTRKRAPRKRAPREARTPTTENGRSLSGPDKAPKYPRSNAGVGKGGPGRRHTIHALENPGPAPRLIPGAVLENPYRDVDGGRRDPSRVPPALPLCIGRVA